MKQLEETSFIILNLLLSRILNLTLAELMQSCLYPPCRYNVYRNDEDNGNVIVNDTSSHVITWNWEVRGGKWNVTYQYIYPGGWYEGIATFINCSNVLNGKEQPYVSWGSSKNWESNALRIYGNAWNITYNGDVFGFIPSEDGKYIFRVFTRNKRHNPFGSEELVVVPETCSLKSSDKAKIRMWWSDHKRIQNCPESDFTLSWVTSRGRWRVFYNWNAETDRTSSSIFYGEHGHNEEEIINWNIDVRQKLITYKTNPIKIQGEPAWNIDLSPAEVWGFSPSDQGKWIVQHFSRNVIFQPFIGG